MTFSVKITLLCLLFSLSVCNAKEFLFLGEYRHVTILKIDYKGIQIAHSKGTGYLDIEKLSEKDKKLIEAELAEYQECLKNKSKAIAEEKAQQKKEAKELKSANAFAATFIKVHGKPRTQQGYLLTLYAQLAKRYKIKMTIPKRRKDGTLPLLYGQYETLRKFVEEKTDGAPRQKEALRLIDQHYYVYKNQRHISIVNRNKRIAEQQRKKAPAKAAAKQPAAPKAAAKPAPKKAEPPKTDKKKK